MFEEAVPQRWPAETAWSLAASFLLHGLLAVAVVTAWSAAPPSVPFDEVIPVNLLIGAWPEVAPTLGPPETARLEPPPTTSPDTAKPLMHATTILSGRALAEPRNRQARADLPKLNAVERMVQLCNIEALEQVARVRSDFFPETVSAYATGGLAIGPDTVEAEGAAIRSGDDWYSLRYRCRLAPGHGAVIAFDFLAGDRLAPARVEALGLPIGK